MLQIQGASGIIIYKLTGYELWYPVYVPRQKIIGTPGALHHIIARGKKKATLKTDLSWLFSFKGVLYLYIFPFLNLQPRGSIWINPSKCANLAPDRRLFCWEFKRPFQRLLAEINETGGQDFRFFYSAHLPQQSTHCCLYKISFHPNSIHFHS